MTIGPFEWLFASLAPLRYQYFVIDFGWVTFFNIVKGNHPKFLTLRLMLAFF